MNTPVPNCVIRVPAKDSYSTSGPTLMGRQSANEGFLTSWFRHSGQREFWCLARFRDEAQVFARIGEQVHQGLDPKPTYRWIAQRQIHRVREVGTLYAPGPQVADLAWVRRRDAQARAQDFSIVGMTHTSCELSIQDALAIARAGLAAGMEFDRASGGEMRLWRFVTGEQGGPELIDSTISA